MQEEIKEELEAAQVLMRDACPCKIPHTCPQHVADAAWSGLPPGGEGQEGWFALLQFVLSGRCLRRLMGTEPRVQMRRRRTLSPASSIASSRRRRAEEVRIAPIPP
eukprot:315353-Hanusia_phi.AAC.1